MLGRHAAPLRSQAPRVLDARGLVGAKTTSACFWALAGCQDAAARCNNARQTGVICRHFFRELGAGCVRAPSVRACTFVTL